MASEGQRLKSRPKASFSASQPLSEMPAGGRSLSGSLTLGSKLVSVLSQERKCPGAFVPPLNANGAPPPCPSTQSLTGHGRGHQADQLLRSVAGRLMRRPRSNGCCGGLPSAGQLPLSHRPSPPAETTRPWCSSTIPLGASSRMVRCAAPLRLWRIGESRPPLPAPSTPPS